jgi:serine phosphatase RsbU (regulator of sigma subunit)
MSRRDSAVRLAVLDSDPVSLAAANDALRREIASGAAVQRLLLPTESPDLMGYRLFSRYHPARSLGGDFYDWWNPYSGCLNLLLGDVSGKGLAASILMATVRSSLRALANRKQPAEILDCALPIVTDTLQRAGQFVTLILLQVELRSGWVRYVDAGHGLALVKRGDEVRPLGGPRGQPLGVGNEPYVQAGFQLGPSHALALFSDGLLDSDPEERMTVEGLAARCSTQRDLAQLVDRLAPRDGAAREFSDDIALVVLEAPESRFGIRRNPR